MPSPAIEVRNVTQDLPPLRAQAAVRHAQERDPLRQLRLATSRPDETFQALRDVSFDVSAGRTYGIIGRNGSGKSTMLKCVAGITKPTTGTVTVNGRISALIELGAGFHPEISGRENVFINGIMLGLSKKEITRRFDEIVRVRRARGLHRRAGEDLLVRHVHAPRVRGGDPRRSRRAARRRGAGGGRRGLHPQVPRQVRRLPAPRQDDPARHAFARAGRALLRRGALARRREGARDRRPEPRRRRLRHGGRGGRGSVARAGGRAGARRGQALASAGGPPVKAPDDPVAVAPPVPPASRRRPTCSRPRRVAGDRARSRSAA